MGKLIFGGKAEAGAAGRFYGLGWQAGRPTKRQRTGAVQDAARVAQGLEGRGSCLDFGGPPPLLEDDCENGSVSGVDCVAQIPMALGEESCATAAQGRQGADARQRALTEIQAFQA